ncbi:Hsp70 family protein [Paenibacillus sp. GCM10027626]|uniref:Hsp70 family protein n=1 Tax=Paenibacillus sp. GCM10027626 TaxID=3273411 RepID=UPI003641912F
MSHSFMPVVGIDLGTTNSAIACIRGGKPELLPSPQGERIIPSVVLIDPQGKVTVGQDARSALVAMPNHTIAAVKRRMGSSLPVRLAGQSFKPQEISALILKELKAYADEYFGEGDKEAVITVPAYFTDEQRRATKEAGELAGFIVERIINEPTAAALAFGLDHLDEDRHLLVYDLGGGTFDVSIVEMMSGIMEVKATAGDHMLGGEDFDWRLVDWMAEKIIQEHGIDPRNDMRGKALLKETAEKVKIDLSSQEQVQISIPLVAVKDNEPIGLTTGITRPQFVTLIEDLLQQTIASIHAVLKDANIKPGQIDEILLVGGSSRIPRVRELIGEIFGKQPRTDIHPDEAVALGAAVQAGLKSGALSKSGLIATDVAPFSMGIAVVEEDRHGSLRPGRFNPIIPRNTTIPVTRTKQYFTTYPGQSAVSIEIFQGEHELVKHNVSLGEFLLEGLPENTEELEGVDVTFRYNLNGILEVTAKSATTGDEMSITVQDSLQRESQEAFQASAARIEELWQQAPEDEEEDELLPDFVDLDEDDLDIWDDIEEDDQNPVAIKEEAQRLLQRAKKLMEKLEGAGSSQLQQLLDQLKSILDSDEIDSTSTRELLDEIVDAMIDLEVD